MKNAQSRISRVLKPMKHVGLSQYVSDQIEYQNQRNIDFLDIKELNDLVGEYRTRIRDLIALYRTAKKTSGNTPLVRRVYTNHETVLLRRQIADLRKLYHMAWADSRELTEDYIRRLKSNAYTTTNI